MAQRWQQQQVSAALGAVRPVWWWLLGASALSSVVALRVPVQSGNLPGMQSAPAATPSQPVDPLSVFSTPRPDLERTAPQVAAAVSLPVELTRPEWVPIVADPFQPSTTAPAVPAPPAPPAPAPAQVTIEPSPPAPPPPPPRPTVAYVGSVTGTDGRLRHFVVAGERHLELAPGVELPGGYVVESVRAASALLRHPSSGAAAELAWPVASEAGR